LSLMRDEYAMRKPAAATRPPPPPPTIADRRTTEHFATTCTVAPPLPCATTVTHHHHASTMPTSTTAIENAEHIEQSVKRNLEHRLDAVVELKHTKHILGQQRCGNLEKP
jgi:hypothetical protein